MIIYIGLIEREQSEGGASILCASFQRATAISQVKAYVNAKYTGKHIEYCLAAFGGDLEEGEFSSEYEIICIVEEEVT